MMQRLILFIAFVFAGLLANATHNRAGEIIYTQVSQLTFDVTVITYALDNAADRDSVNMDWGDGSPVQPIARQNGPVGGINGVPQGELFPNADNTKKNVYGPVRHTFPGALPFFVISIVDPNRISSIVNINNGASVQIPFYLEDTLRIYDPTFVGLNTSPVLLNPPIDYAKVDEIFEHNPAAFDPDGDSLVYELIVPFRQKGLEVPNYEFPEEVDPAPDVFTIDVLTGDIVWNTPQQQGIYTIAILITEYRNGIELGTVLRDMQIIVVDNVNDPPVLNEIRDTCILAGSPLEIDIRATDPNVGQTVILEAFGGPLDAATIEAPAAQFTSGGINPANGTFFWQTSCDHIRRQFYQVVFKASDNFSPIPGQPNPLVDLETWTIEVVAPPPENVTADPVNNTVEVNWDDPYSCFVTDKFIGFSVWRREGSNPFPPDTCMKGLAGQGYVKIADRLTVYTHIDSNVVRGKNYCYRVLAEFAERTSFGLLYNKVESMPSNEACSELKKDLPLITHVTVVETDQITGRTIVSWSKPLAGVDGLDTLQLPGPYEYRVARADGFGTAFTEIQTFTSATFSGLNDTTFNDSGLNTQTQPHTYKIDFYSNGTFVGASETASSVFLTLDASDRKMTLTWEERVPWTNEEYSIFRQDPGTSVFNFIGTSLDSVFVDEGLVNDSLYCYYVQSTGGYTITGVVDPIINLSQIACARPIDTLAPCPPVLMVENACDDVDNGEFCSDDLSQLKNALNWTNPSNSCEDSDDTEKYYVYFDSPITEETDPMLIDSIFGAADTFYFHSTIDGSLAGCYFVTAVDSAGNESEPSNIECVDNCPCYKLPNVFTPNNDGSNDFFVPFTPFRYIDRIDMKIYDRWGTLVFETTDPEILWNGNDMNSGKPMKEGTYYYSCKTFEIRVDGVNQSPDILEGYIRLIRGNGGENP